MMKLMLQLYKDGFVIQEDFFLGALAMRTLPATLKFSGQIQLDKEIMCNFNVMCNFQGFHFFFFHTIIVILIL